MALSQTALQGVLASATSATFLETLTITHSQISTLRLVSDKADLYRAFQNSDIAVDATNNNDGTLVNGPTWTSDGPNENMRGALGFDLDNNESNEHVDTGTDVGDPQQYTVEFWVNTADPDIDGNNNYRELVDGARVTLEQGGTIAFRTPGVAPNSNERTVSSAIQFDQWEHVACVYDQVDRIIYINGQEDVRENVGSGTINLATLLIGFQVPGYMTDVRIWNTARTQQQIQDNMNARLNGFESGLVGYWPLDDTTERFNRFPFQVTAPSQTQERPPEISIKADMVDQRIMEAVRQLSGLREKAQMTYEVVLATSPDTVEFGPVEFEYDSASTDGLTSITLKASFLRGALNDAFPARQFAPNNAG